MGSYSTTKKYFTYFIVISLIIICVSVFIEIKKNLFNAANNKMWLGIETIELNSALIQKYDIHAIRGLLVTRVFTGSPAELSGIKKGDVLRRWNGVSIINQQDFKQFIQKTNVNNRVKLNINRQNKPVLIRARFGFRPGTF